MVLYVCDKEWLIRLGYRAHGRAYLVLEITGIDSESLSEGLCIQIGENMRVVFLRGSMMHIR